MDNRKIKDYMNNIELKIRNSIRFLKYVVCIRKIVKKITWIFTTLFILLIVSKYPLKQDKNIMELSKLIKEILKNIAIMAKNPEVRQILAIFLVFVIAIFSYSRPNENKYFYKRILNLFLILWIFSSILFILMNPLNISYYLILGIFIAIHDIIEKYFEIDFSFSKESSIFSSRSSKAKYLVQLINTNRGLFRISDKTGNKKFLTSL